MPLHQGALVVSELEQLNVCDLEQVEGMSPELAARANSGCQPSLSVLACRPCYEDREQLQGGKAVLQPTSCYYY